MTKYRSSGLKPGDPISDSNAIIVALTKVRKSEGTMENGIVLCLLPGNDVTPWVTWRFNTNRELESTALPNPKPSCYTGHYAYSWLEATGEFTKRIVGWPLDERSECWVEEGDIPARWNEEV